MRMSDGSLEETIALARRIFNEDRRDADAPVGGAAKAYRMPSTTLRDAHEDLLQREASTSGQMKTRRMIIAGGPKHYCASRSLDRLEMMPLRELSVPGRNRCTTRAHRRAYKLVLARYAVCMLLTARALRSRYFDRQGDPPQNLQLE